MNLLEHQIQCPYCWQQFTVLIDDSIENQEYIEDCQVCCRPISMKITTGLRSDLAVAVFREDE